jgi:hypothetical protein
MGDYLKLVEETLNEATHPWNWTDDEKKHLKDNGYKVGKFNRCVGGWAEHPEHGRIEKQSFPDHSGIGFKIRKNDYHGNIKDATDAHRR